ncbi:uncharacterized protein LY79DRAFT_670818 [Colletotrichum navitas]|uniref:Uncharacterized protein n=1 Tax=Colletotrichum navitas TaxID=681940 RepID=A0AAD8PX59_9PEZI|nr:uncharacterized protein LY79DRAFT_670818 [Colletotrichum navitas]KAK1585810.1 hypothetical protein LY79DRAFT_670818 [Colletotrichum navitas]
MDERDNDLRGLEYLRGRAKRAYYLYVQPGAATDTLGEEQHAGLTVLPCTPPCFTTPHGLHVTNTYPRLVSMDMSTSPHFRRELRC